MTAPASPGATPALMTWPDLLERPRPEPNETIGYGTDALQVADLWLPAGHGPHPTVLMVHGGCWQTEIADRRIMNWIAEDLRKRGIAVWNIDYRGVDREGGGYPGTFLDAAAAADALRDAAPRYNLDIDQIVAVGHSAGGHLALWLAARSQWQRGGLRIGLKIEGGSVKKIERKYTRKIEQVLRNLRGWDRIESNVRPGRSVTWVGFSAEADIQDALSEAKRSLLALGLKHLSVELAQQPVPRESPLRSGTALPISVVISLGGLPDLEEAARPPGSGCGTEVVARLTGAPGPDRPDVFADTSIPRLAPLGVRQVLINGLQDRIIPTAYAEAYAAPMRMVGDWVEVRMIDRTGHVELIAPETEAWAATAEEIEGILHQISVPIRMRTE
jgi:pimeloyl-ACP methyl ester carboxylesterase